MRDNHKGLPEIRDAYERDGKFFGVVGVEIAGEVKIFEFGVDHDGYRALRRILQARPLGRMDINAYRYFFVPRVRRLAEQGRVEFYIRIEGGRDGRQFSFIAPEMLVRNLKWFSELKSLVGTEHLNLVLPKQD